MGYKQKCRTTEKELIVSDNYYITVSNLLLIVTWYMELAIYYVLV